MNALARFHDAATRAGFALGAACIAGMAALYAFEVAMRYVFGAPTRWTADFVVYLMCVSVFLCLPEVTRTAGHVAILSFVDRLQGRARRLAGQAIAAVSALATGAAGWIAADEALRQFAMGIQTLAAVPIPRWWLAAAIAYGFLGSALHLVRQAVAPPGRFGVEHG